MKVGIDDIKNLVKGKTLVTTKEMQRVFELRLKAATNLSDKEKILLMDAIKNPINTGTEEGLKLACVKFAKSIGKTDEEAAKYAMMILNDPNSKKKVLEIFQLVAAQSKGGFFITTPSKSKYIETLKSKNKNLSQEEIDKLTEFYNPDNDHYQWVETLFHEASHLRDELIRRKNIKIPDATSHGFDFDRLPSVLREYFTKDKNTEILARGTQVKNALGLEAGEKLTGEELKEVAQAWKDSGMSHNSMNAFFSSITDYDKAADYINKYSLAIAGAAVGAGALAATTMSDSATYAKHGAKLQQGGLINQNQDYLTIDDIVYPLTEDNLKDFDDDLKNLYYKGHVKYGELDESAIKMLMKKYNISSLDDLNRALAILLHIGRGDALVQDLPEEYGYYDDEDSDYSEQFKSGGKFAQKFVSGGGLTAIFKIGLDDMVNLAKPLSGVSKKYLEKFISPVKNIRVHTAEDVAEYFGISIEEAQAKINKKSILGTSKRRLNSPIDTKYLGDAGLRDTLQLRIWENKKTLNTLAENYDEWKEVKQLYDAINNSEKKEQWILGPIAEGIHGILMSKRIFNEKVTRQYANYAKELLQLAQNRKVFSIVPDEQLMYFCKKFNEAANYSNFEDRLLYDTGRKVFKRNRTDILKHDLIERQALVGNEYTHYAGTIKYKNKNKNNTESNNTNTSENTTNLTTDTVADSIIKDTDDFDVIESKIKLTINEKQKYVDKIVISKIYTKRVNGKEKLFAKVKAFDKDGKFIGNSEIDEKSISRLELDGLERSEYSKGYEVHHNTDRFMMQLANYKNIYRQRHPEVGFTFSSEDYSNMIREIINDPRIGSNNINNHIAVGNLAHKDIHPAFENLNSSLVNQSVNYGEIDTSKLALLRKGNKLCINYFK